MKSYFKSPWFDSECFEAYREKERAHNKFKENSRIEDNTQNIIQSDIKFKHKRQLFKTICNRKMRDNLYNEDDPVLITKKFWSHVKSNSKSSRVPETMHLIIGFVINHRKRRSFLILMSTNNFLVHRTIALI